MSHSLLGGVPQHFWLKAAVAPHRLLMLDYDGTLAPFHVERDKATPLPRVIPLLQTVSQGTRTEVAIVSGRPLAELEPLVAPLRVVLVGEHGWEERTPSAPVVRYPLPEPARAALERAADAAAARGWDDRLERKRASLVLHTRGMSAQLAAETEDACAELWRDEASVEGLRLVRVNGGLELRLRGRHKGTAVRRLMARSRPGTFPVYLGDDATDEDAFAAVLRNGLGIRVGPNDPETVAGGWLPGCEAMPEFLERWLTVVEGRRPARAE